MSNCCPIGTAGLMRAALVAALGCSASAAASALQRPNIFFVLQGEPAARPATHGGYLDPAACWSERHGMRLETLRIRLRARSVAVV